jgi:hypothetical protein
LDSRKDTTFSTTVPGFERDHSAFDINERAIIDRYINRFESDYQNSITDMDLRGSYNKEVHATHPYKLWQIYLTRNYRAFVLFRKDCLEAYWIALFRKGKQREQKEIEVAKARASEFWNSINKRR